MSGILFIFNSLIIAAGEYALVSFGWDLSNDRMAYSMEFGFNFYTLSKNVNLKIKLKATRFVSVLEGVSSVVIGPRLKYYWLLVELGGGGSFIEKYLPGRMFPTIVPKLTADLMFGVSLPNCITQSCLLITEVDFIFPANGTTDMVIIHAGVGLVI